MFAGGSAIGGERWRAAAGAFQTPPRIAYAEISDAVVPLWRRSGDIDVDPKWR